MAVTEVPLMDMVEATVLEDMEAAAIKCPILELI